MIFGLLDGVIDVFSGVASHWLTRPNDGPHEVRTQVSCRKAIEMLTQRAETFRLDNGRDCDCIRVSMNSGEQCVRSKWPT